MENKTSRATSPIIMHFCKVVSVDDEQRGERIKVRIPHEDDNKRAEDVPYCFPLLPKHIHVKPKVGECVIVILATQGAYMGKRFYIGPIISQEYLLYNDSYDVNARNLLMSVPETRFGVFKNPTEDEENRGTLIRSDEDIAIRGRSNADVVLRDSEIQMRCGFQKQPHAYEIDKRLKFNDKDFAYIQMQYKRRTDEKNREFFSNINIVADRINLLSHDSKTNFDLIDKETRLRDGLLTDRQLDEVLEKAHALPYGDELVSFLKELIRIFQEHTHPYSMMPPCLNSADTDVLATDLDKMLSQSIKIN